MKLNLAAPLDVADMLTGPSGTSSDDVTDEASPAGIALAGLTELIDAQRNSDVVETTALPPAGDDRPGRVTVETTVLPLAGDDLSGRVAKAKSDAAAFLESLSRKGRSCIKVLSVSCARRVIPRDKKTKRFVQGTKATFLLKERVSALDKISTLVEAACLFKRHRKMGSKFVSTVFPKARFHFIGNRCGYVVEVPQLVFVEIAADDAPGRVTSWGTHPKPKAAPVPRVPSDVWVPGFAEWCRKRLVPKPGARVHISKIRNKYASSTALPEAHAAALRVALSSRYSEVSKKVKNVVEEVCGTKASDFWIGSRSKSAAKPAVQGLGIKGYVFLENVDDGSGAQPVVTQRPPKRNVEAIGLAGSAPLPNKRSRKAVLPFCPCDPSGGASAWKEPKTPSPVVYAVGGDDDEDEDFTGGEAAVEDYEG